MSTEENNEGTTQLRTLADMEFPPIEFGLTEAALDELSKRFKDIPDPATDEGYEFVKDGVKELTGLRTAIETRRKDLKAPALTWGRDVDKLAKSIIAAIKKIEEPLRVAKTKVDEEKQRIAREAAEKETKRVNSIQDRIAEIKAYPTTLEPGKTSADYGKALDTMASLRIEEDLFMEFTEEAMEARQLAIYTLTDLRNQAEQLEREEKKRAEEQAEIDRQKKEQDERQAELDRQQAEIDKQKREAKEAEEAAEREKAEAEEKRVADIRFKINNIKEAANGLEYIDSEQIAGIIALLKAEEPDADVFEEFHAIAQQTWVETLAVLEEARESVAEAEAAQRADEEARKPDREKLIAWLDSIESAAYKLPEVTHPVAAKFVERNRKEFKKLIDRACDVVSKM